MATGKTILIVEDDMLLCDLFSTVLKSSGYSVTTVRKGKDALEKIKKSDYNIALIDIGLPDMNGIELLKKIRTSNGYIILIIITGKPDLDSSIESINYGANGYLVKPVDNKDLVATVERKLRQQEESEILSDEKVSDWLKNRLSRMSLEREEYQT
jgi:two-component system, cell cycle response regulator CtrA